MNIVVLDGYTLNPGDLQWSGLEALGCCTVYDRTAPHEVLQRAAGAEIVLTNKTVLDRSVIENLPELKYIGVLATGYNVVDVTAARERAIPVTNVPGYSTRSVSQLVFALLLEMTRQVGHHAARVRGGAWCTSADFSFWETPQVELEGKVLGLVGFGAIGRDVARLALAFGMEVLVHTAHPDKYRDLPEGNQVSFVDLEVLFFSSDVVSLHCPLTAKTEGLINARRLTAMKRGALLINTGRGPLVDEAALAEALDSGHLGGAGLDVLCSEPPPADNPLLSAKNCFITPHIAWATTEARQRLMDIAVANAAAFVAGEPINVVN